MKTVTEFAARLKELDACSEARLWAKDHTAKWAWDNCRRGDWLLWWSKKEDVDLKTLTLAKGLCAKTVYHLMKDERSRKAVDTAIAFGEGKASREELNAAAAAAYAAYAAYAAAYAAYAAAYAAYAAADAAAYAADAAAYAAAAADAADYAAYAAAAVALIANQRQTADIVRKIIKPNFL